MPERVIASREPVVLELEPGTYWWCSCGRSMTQPFCDGSHEGPPHTGCEPVEFTVKERKRYSLCLCKHTRHAPMCDSFHKFLPPK